MSPTPDIRTTFFQECDDLLEALVDGLTTLQDDAGDDPETLHAIFRSVHSIKGGAGAFGLEPLVRFAHVFETLLDELREGRVALTQDLIALLFRANDELADLVAAAQDGRDDPGASALMAELAAAAGTAPPEADDAPEDATMDFVPLTLSFGGTGPSRFRIRFSPHRRLYANGHDPLHLLEALADLGDVRIVAGTDRLPDFDSLDWEDGYLDWTMVLETDHDLASVQEIFEFVEGLADLDITPDLPDPGGPGGPGGPAGPGDADGAAPGPGDASPPDAAAAVPAAGATAPTPAAGPAGGTVGAGPQPGAKAGAPVASTIRVDLDRIDGLINAVGELAITQAMISQKLSDAGVAWSSDIGTGMDAFRNLTSEIQERVMAIRAQPIKPLFQRMARIVREAATMSGKTARLVTEGEGTEVDKTVIERLADPLTHILRNAVDHGLEKPGARTDAGKAPEGQVRLTATYRAGRVVIEVEDDGAGINRARVRAIAEERGLIDPAQELADSEIDKLLFMPGFSTASEVSDLSGRGVGMDVVKRAIHALGGRIGIQSTPGHGTTISISLPLTLAVLDGILVETGGETMVVPISAVVETLRPEDGALHDLGQGDWVIRVRGAVVPVIDLARHFGIGGGDRPGPILLIVENENGTPFALAVDAIRDQRQVVIKGLEGNYRHVPGIAAATILGDGHIALIIDPEETVAGAGKNAPPALQAATR